MPYGFRVRFFLPHPRLINSTENELRLSDASESPCEARIVALNAETLAEATKCAIVGKGYERQAEADEAGQRWRGEVQKALARINIGADFGRHRVGGASAYLIRMMSEQGIKVVNDDPGVVVFEDEPWPIFVDITGDLTVGRDLEALKASLDAAHRLRVTTTDRERLAYDLYSASFFLSSPDARFMMLMMAVETLLVPEPRSNPVRKHVQQLIADTKSADIPASEICSIVGTLEYLASESITQAGKRFAKTLGDKTYSGDTPAKFFAESYRIRSRLAHGKMPRPQLEKVNSHEVDLREFVSHLLARDLLDEVD